MASHIAAAPTRHQTSMKLLLAGLLVSSALFGCASTTNVVVAKPGETQAIHAVAFAPQGGNSADMDAHVERDLLARGVAVKTIVTPGTRKAADVDAVVTYSDTWHWDLVMYLESLDLNIFDAKSGSLLATGHWENSRPHGFPNPATIIKKVMDEMFAKMGAANPDRTAEAAAAAH